MSVFLCFATVQPDFLHSQTPVLFCFCSSQEKWSGISFQEIRVLAPINPTLRNLKGQKMPTEGTLEDRKASLLIWTVLCFLTKKLVAKYAVNLNLTGFL